MTRPVPMSQEEIEVALAGSSWTIENDRLVLAHRFASFAQAAGFVMSTVTIAAELDHHPDIDLRFDRVRLRVWTHDVGALTRLDVDLATKVQALLRGEARAEHRATERWSAR